MATFRNDLEAAGARPFTGSPKDYRRIAKWGAIVLHAYLFCGYWAIQRFLVGEPWPSSWWPLIATVGSAILFARFAYRWMMRLDAQYGRGSGWELQSVTVKLPRENASRQRIGTRQADEKGKGKEPE